MFGKNARKIFSRLLILVCLMASLGMLVKHSSEASKGNVDKNSEAAVSLPQNPPGGGQPQAGTTCGGEVTQQIIYAPVMGTPEVRNSEIIFNCRSPQSMEVTPTFYTEAGYAVVGKPVHLNPAEIRYVNVKKLIPSQYRHMRRWGGISLSYTGRTLEVWAQIRLLGRAGGSADVHFSILKERRSDIREAVWWMPQDGMANIILGNSSDRLLNVTANFSDGISREVQIWPFATEIIQEGRGSERRVDSLQGNDGRAVSVTLKSSGVEGSLIAAGFVSTPSGKITNSIRFYDTRNAAQSSLFANNFKISRLDQRLVLKNTSDSYVMATPHFLPSAGKAGHSVELSSVQIAPHNVTEVDLSPLLENIADKPEIASLSVQILNNGKPGSLIGGLYSTTDDGLTHDVPLRDYGPLRNSTGSYPWRIDGDYSTEASITNLGDETAEFIVQIHHEGGRYVVGPKKLTAGESVVFNLRKIRDERVPDNTGQVIPLDVAVGQFRWSLYSGTSTRLVGRSEIVSKANGVSNSYSCPLPCGPNFDHTYMQILNFADFYEDTSYFDIGLNDTNIGYGKAMEMRRDIYGGLWGPYDCTQSATWSSRNTSIATSTCCGEVRGVTEGQTNVDAVWDTTEWYEYQGECAIRSISVWAGSLARVGIFARDAYQFLSGTNFGGRWGYGVCDYTPTCIGRCTVPNYSGDKRYPGPCPEPYLQCVNLYIYGACGLKSCVDRDQPGFCD